MLISYPAIIYKDGEAYSVEFPDLPGCLTYGKTIPDAMVSAEEALGLFIATLIEEDINYNAPSDIVSIKSGKGFCSLVTTDVDEFFSQNKAVKKTLTLPKWLNTKAERSGINFSQILQTAIKQKLGII
ncbi:MAG: type II toxin-antitoxin system HicB family antitoxin [Ruminococcus sp.]|jgi:predicted RNase H-like HicB family nuclease|nr:type II toxin-antitoxin system HicB family antitoxin [Ruminococcus sp.]